MSSWFAGSSRKKSNQQGNSFSAAPTASTSSTRARPTASGAARSDDEYPDFMKDAFSVIASLKPEEKKELEKLQPDGDPNVDVERLAAVYALEDISKFCTALTTQIKANQSAKGEMFRSLKNTILTAAYLLSPELRNKVNDHVDLYAEGEAPKGNNLNNYIGYIGSKRWEANVNAIAKFMQVSTEE